MSYNIQTNIIKGKDVLSISRILDKLNIVYYSYDLKNNMLVLDKRYSNTHTLGELIKLTYYFTSKRIKFDVLKDKSIIFEKDATIPYKVKRALNQMVVDLKNNQKNIYLLNDKKVKYAKNLPLFDIKFLKNLNCNIDQYDALVFTSQNGILALNEVDDKWKNIPSFVISEQSGKLIKELNGKLKFFSRARHGDFFAQELIPLLKDKKVLYVRGEKVASDIMSILIKEDIDCDEVVMYKNIELSNIVQKKLPKNATIVFSSPSTVEYFLKHYQWEETYKAVAIGNTTAQCLPECIKYVIADTTSLESCVQKAIEIN